MSNEGQQDMQNSSEVPGSSPSSRETKLILSFAKLPFTEIIAREKTLENLLQSQSLEEERKLKIELSLKVLIKRKNKLVDDVVNSGKLYPIDQKLEVLKLKGFTPEDLNKELDAAKTLDDESGISKSDKHYGVLGWYYRKELDKLLEDLKERGKRPTPVQEGQQRQQTQVPQSPDVQPGQHQSPPDSHGEVNTASEQLSDKEGEAEKIIKQLDILSQRLTEAVNQGKTTGENTAAEIKALSDEIRNLMLRLGGKGLPDPELGGQGTGRVPNVERDGEGGVEEWFRGRLHVLIEEQADQSFDQNWRLVYPLEATIMSLMPENRLEDKHFELRQRLSKELAASRNIHNFIYVYRRVGGVTPLIEASSFLSKDTISTLLKDPKVATYLRKFQKMGEDCFKCKQELFAVKHLGNNGDLLGGRTGSVAELQLLIGSQESGDVSERTMRSVDELDKLIGTLENQAKDMMLGYPSGNLFEKGDFWAVRIAGGLYSGLHESAMDDLQINESGDFFSDRLYHCSERAAEQWENWDRTPRPSLYESLDLRLPSFWQKVLQARLKELKDSAGDKNKGRKLFKEQCSRLEISVEFGVQLDENGDPVYGKNGEPLEGDQLVSYSLSEALFEKMNFSNQADENYFRLKSDEVKQVVLTLDDADKIRKAIFDPAGLLDRPNLQMLAGLWEQFKHLKGSRRSDWFKEVTKEIVLLFKDTVSPGVDSFPGRLRRSPSREFYPDMVPWTNTVAEMAIKKMTPPLTSDDQEELLEELIGGKMERGTIKVVKTAGDVLLGAIGDFFKGAFGIR